MKTFKKLIISIFIFLLVIFIFSYSIITTLINSEWEHCFDLNNRDNLAGSIDFLVCGASQGMNHYNTYTIDENSYTCYNLSGPAITWSARSLILEEELSRNDVKYVVIDISHNSLLQEPSVSGEYYGLPRITKSNQLNYFFTEISFTQQFELYGKLMNEGVKYNASRFLGKSSLLGTTDQINNCNYSDKGFRFAASSDITLSEQEIIQNHNIKKVSTDFPVDNIRNLNEMVLSCKKYGAQPIIVQSIASDKLNWEYSGSQDLHDYLVDYCKNNNCLYIDANLLIERYSIFSDESSFVDDQHLSGEGATKFTEIFCEMIKLYEDNVDITNMFFESYTDMEEHSPYMKYYLAHK